MNEEFNEPIENWEKSSTEIVPTELHILVTRIKLDQISQR